MTDAPSRQDTPENEDGHLSPDPAAAKTVTQPVTQPATQSGPGWASDQPAPAPWFLGQPSGQTPPQWPHTPPPMPPLPPPSPDQAAWPNQAPGTRPEDPGKSGTAPGRDGTGQGPSQGQGEGQGRGAAPGSGSVPPWTGQAPPNPEQPANPNPYQPAPWNDPNRYGQPGGPPPGQQPRQRSPYGPPPQQQQRRDPSAPGEKRPPLDLRTRWARGLAVGGASCTLVTLLNGYQNFNAWLIGGAVGLVLSLAALWCGALAQVSASREMRRAPEAVGAVVWSAVSTLVALFIVALSMIFFTPFSQYSDCMNAANTISGQTACQTQLHNSLSFKP